VHCVFQSKDPLIIAESSGENIDYNTTAMNFEQEIICIHPILNAALMNYNEPIISRFVIAT